MPDPLFSDADRERIREAVAAAERRTSGEIVPYVVRKSGDYDVALWRASAAGAVSAGALALGIAAIYAGWGLGWLYSAWAMALVMVAGGALGAVAASTIGALRRGLTGPALLAETVHRRAAQAFVDEEVFDTVDRTGILLFVSLLEHRIEVVGDKGIDAKVEPGEWIETVALVRTGILQGDLAGGLVAAIDHCGDLLHRRGVVLRDDDTDELSDDVRVHDE